MADFTGLLVFTVEGVRLAVGLEQVDRVVRAASLKPLPGAPDIILGMLNLHGVPVPVISLRKRLKLEDREMETTDEIVIVKRQQALLGIIVDEVEDVTNVKSIAPLADAAHLTHLSGAVQLQGDIVLVQDIEKFLSLDEEVSLAHALVRGAAE